MQPIYSYIYGIPYVLVVLVLLYFSYHEKRERTRKIAIYAMGGILILFFGLRGFVQTDWYLYYWLYYRVPSFLDSGIYFERRIEPGFMFVTQIFKTITDDYHVWVLLNTIVDIVAFTFIFKRYSRSIAWSWIMFICFSGIILEFNLMRNVKAVILFLLALPYLEKRQFWKFLLIWIVAMLMHTSAIFYLPAYFVLTKNWGRVWPIVLFLSVNVIFFFKAYPTTLILSNFYGMDSAFVGKALGYLANAEAEQGLTFGYFERLLMFILVYFLYAKLYQQRKSNRIFCNSFYIYYALWYVFSDVPVFVERMPVLFAFSYWIIIPNMMGLAKGQLRRIVNVFAIAFAVMKVLILTDHILYDYDNQAWGIKSKEERMVDMRRYENSSR